VLRLSNTEGDSVRGQPIPKLLPKTELDDRQGLKFRHLQISVWASLMRALVPLVKRPRLALLRTVAVAALGAAVTATGAGAATAKVIGPDVSSHNHDNRAALNWLIMHRVGGAEFTFIKATEGGGYRNPNFSSDFASARQRGVIRGPTTTPVRAGRPVLRSSPTRPRRPTTTSTSRTPWVGLAVCRRSWTLRRPET